MDLDVPKYSNLDATRASGVEASTIRSYFQRDVLTLGPKDVDAAVNGAGRSLTARRVLQIAITGVLARQGVQPRRAAMLAAGFTDIGNGPLPQNGFRERLPGQLYIEDPDPKKRAFTWLVAQEGRDFALIVPVDGKTAAILVIDRNAGPSLVLPLDPIVTAVLAALEAIDAKASA